MKIGYFIKFDFKLICPTILFLKLPFTIMEKCNKIKFLKTSINFKMCLQTWMPGISSQLYPTSNKNSGKKIYRIQTLINGFEHSIASSTVIG